MSIKITVHALNIHMSAVIRAESQPSIYCQLCLPQYSIGKNIFSTRFLQPFPIQIRAVSFRHPYREKDFIS